jgi:hypothetical protein
MVKPKWLTLPIVGVVKTKSLDTASGEGGKNKMTEPFPLVRVEKTKRMYLVLAYGGLEKKMANLSPGGGVKTERLTLPKGRVVKAK